MTEKTSMHWDKSGKTHYYINGKPATYFAHSKANKDIEKKYGTNVVWSINDKISTKCEYNLAKLFKPNKK